MARFSDMLDYFGQSPIVVRSSSLLEDTFLNSFPGKYESVFCPNQGTRQRRLEQFLHAVRLVYASSFSEDALLYRAKRGLLDRDEQMALLVQRVSGNKFGPFFYPHLAGVGMSLNPFVWSPELDPTAGLVRLVFGLGTRAVDRNDDDYTRIISLDLPLKRPESSTEDIREHTQRRIDYLDLERNQFESDYFSNVVERSPGLCANAFAKRRFVEGRDGTSVLGAYELELDGLLRKTTLVSELRAMLSTLRKAYGCEVEIEFTANFRDCDDYTIHLLQCRPLRVRGRDSGIDATSSSPDEIVLIRSHGAVLGSSRVAPIERICYVSVSEYGRLPMRDRYAVARLVGRIVRASVTERVEHLLLVGPGRFGTTVPELGVPVTSGELNGVSVLCEIDRMHEGLNPELSFGTHFFHEIVESDLLYIGCAVTSESSHFEQDYFESAENRLGELFPADCALEDVVRIIEPPIERRLTMRADNVAQEALLCMR
ncbi:MAG: PEP/pyruvate-binding domain-containing protein [Polyangiaceae bacterium]